MTKLFIHNPWFRLFGPLFSGTLVYLLILLVNDSVLLIQEDFLSQELFVCIGLAYLTQEFSRLSLLLFERLKSPKSFVLRIIIQLLGSVLLTICLVSTAMFLYFKYILLYEPNFRELYIFNSIYSFITLLYVVLYLGHFFLFRRNTKKIEKEELAKLSIDNDFSSYLKGINPELLFESLEAMLVTMKESPASAENLTDHFSDVYRYILSKRKREIVPIEEELEVTQSLIQLLNHLPHRKVKLGKIIQADGKILPTTLLRLIECIVRTTIASEKKALTIAISENENALTITYEPEEKLKESLTLNTIQEIVHGYQFYSETPISILMERNTKIIQLPKLTYHESGDNRG